MGGPVDRRPARVDADPVGAQRDERPGLAGQRVVQAEASSDRLDGGDDQRRDRPAGALGAVEVAARGLDVDRAADRARAGRRSRRASASRWAPSRGRAAMTVRSTATGRQPAASTRRRTSLDEHARWRCRAASARRPGRAARGRPAPAAPSSASATAWRTTSPSEWPARRGAPGDLDAAEAQRHPGPERVAVVADPGPRRPTRRRARAPPAEGRPGSVTLRLPGSPGTTWTAMLQASSRAASSVNVSGPSAGNRR